MEVCSFIQKIEKVAVQMRKQRKIRNYLIETGIQLDLTWKLLIIVILSFVVSGTIVLWSTWAEIEGYVPYALITDIKWRLLRRSLLLSIPIILFFSVACIVVTHRIAGPIHKVEKYLDKIKRDGTLEALRLREGDGLKSLAQKLNEVFSSIKSRK